MVKIVCAWCGKEISKKRSAKKLTSHGICGECSYLVEYKKVKLSDLLDRFKDPVLAVNSGGVVISGNRAALKYLGKKPADIENKLGGEVISCVYSEFPGGCGRTIHCSGCAIRNAVTETFKTGKNQLLVPTYQYIRTGNGVEKIHFTISTYKVGKRVFLKIDDAD